MSQTVLTRENLTTIEPRRAPLRNADSDMNSQRQTNRRSLSGKFRNLFRKSSPSPTRPTSHTVERTHSSSIQRRSPSPESSIPATEAPHLRAPVLNWPFGKKKSKLTGSTSEKVKKKETRKSAKTSTTSAYQDVPQTSIRGQNFVPRTPELTHETAGRTQTSTSSYETTTTKGYRGYIVIDGTKSTQQEAAVDADVAIPPAYVSDRSRSPSFEYNHRHQTSPLSDIEIIPKPKQTQSHNNHSSLSATQVLVENNPIFSSKTSSHQWNTTSNTSLNNAESRPTSSSSMDVDVPKLNAPLIPSMSSTHTKDLKPTQSLSNQDEYYRSLSTVSNLVQPNRSYTVTYGSLPDTNNIQKENLNPIKSTNSHTNSYPGLSAIVEHHFRPSSFQFNKHPSTITTTTTTSPKRTLRFDTSTTTINDYNDNQQWPNKGSISSPISNHQHDGFIRPLTPPKPTIIPDISTIHLHVDDSRGQTFHSTTNETPKVYRSSTTIYTKEKFSSPNGGELKTWSIQGNNENERYQRPSTSIHIPPTHLSNDYSYNSKSNFQDNTYEYNVQRSQHYSDYTWNSSYSRSERDSTYDQPTRSYKLTEYTQEPLNTITPVENSEVDLRHYTLKRTKSYDGLGLLISADAETRLNHRIREVENDSPGLHAGLRKNDRIIAVNDINVEQKEFNDVLVLIKHGLDNNSLRFSVVHDQPVI